jgi:divalent metal cation (Fe/Co/Zn/Cd) transporter
MKMYSNPNLVLRDPSARALATSVLFGIAALTLDVVAVLLSNSAALRADLVRGAADTAAAVFAFLIHAAFAGAVRQSDQSARMDRWESVSCSLTAAAIIIGVACMIGVLAERMVHPVIITGTLMGLVVALLNLACNVWLLAINHTARRNDPSPILDSQARVIRVKMLGNVTLLTTIGGATFAPAAAAQLASDNAGVLIQSSFGLWTAGKLLRRHGRALLRRRWS